MHRFGFIFIFIFLVFSVVIQENLPNYLTEAVSSLQNIKGSNIISDEEIILTAVGDVSFSRGVEWAVKRANNINYPFLNTEEYLNGDIVFANLESPITEGREIRTGEMIFRSNPGTEKALKDAGFTIVSLANNHTPDFKNKGITDTFGFLDDVGIKYVGAGINSQTAYRPVILNIKGLNIAFLAYSDPNLVPSSYEASENNPGTAFMDIDKLYSGIKEAEKQADLIIVSMHSGIEYVNNPNKTQIDFAHAAIDHGAHLVIGHHPHVVQTVEKYKDKFIVYSLGNFVFDQMWSQETREGLILKAILNKGGVKSLSFIPTVIENYSQPRLAHDTEREKILNRLNYQFNED